MIGGQPDRFAERACRIFQSPQRVLRYAQVEPRVSARIRRERASKETLGRDKLSLPEQGDAGAQ
jgi:hypothetical protein